MLLGNDGTYVHGVLNKEHHHLHHIVEHIRSLVTRLLCGEEDPHGTVLDALSNTFLVLLFVDLHKRYKRRQHPLLGALALDLQSLACRLTAHHLPDCSHGGGPPDAERTCPTEEFEECRLLETFVADYVVDSLLGDVLEEVVNLVTRVEAPERGQPSNGAGEVAAAAAAVSAA